MHYSCIIHSLTVVVGGFDLKRWLKCRLVLKMIGDKNCSTCKDYLGRISKMCAEKLLIDLKKERRHVQKKLE